MGWLSRSDRGATHEMCSACLMSATSRLGSSLAALSCNACSAACVHKGAINRVACLGTQCSCMRTDASTPSQNVWDLSSHTSG